MDTRGLTTQSLGAYDDVNTALGTRDIGHADLQGHRDARRQLQSDTEWSLQALAQETGGFLLRNQNDLAKGVERVLEDQRGYYVIGYARDATSVKGAGAKPSFHEMKLSVTRPGLQVRSRAGFYGAIDPDAPDAAPAAATTLAEALASPFASGDIRLELTSLFVQEPRGGYLLRSLLHLDTRGLELREVDGRLGTRLETLAVTFGDNGTVVDQLSRAQELSVTPDQLDRAHQEGLTLRLDVPVKKPGAYQLRVAVRDARSGRIGSANQLVQVPDLGNKTLALSGIVVGSVEADGTPSEAGFDTTAALRRFRRGQALSYSFAVYNARFDRTSGRSKLGARMRLFHDDQLVTVGEQRPIEPSAANDPRQLMGGGAFMLGPEMPLGDYVLQVIVSDALVGKPERRVASQAVAFEVTGDSN